MTVLASIEHWARRSPDAPAVSDDRETLTYRGLLEHAVAVAGRVRRAGARRGAIVALDTVPSARGVAAAVGVLRAGAAYLALDPALPAERRAAQVADARPHLVLGDGGPSTLPSTGVPLLRLAEPELASVPDDHRPGDRPEPGDPAYVIYTSGTTGQPKGVLVHHGGLAIAATEGARRFGLGPGVRMLQAASWSFDAAVWETFMALVSGAELVVAPLDRVDVLVTGARVDAAMLTPTVAAWLPAHPPVTLQTLGFGGERVPAALPQRFAGVPTLLNCYGPAETSICVAMHTCRADGQDPPVGRPVPGARAYVLDGGWRRLPSGEIGELAIGGTVVGLGYLGQPSLTAERFVPDPHSAEPGARMYLTGDLARIDPEGAIHVLGRADDQVKVRGVRIELAEVEAAVRALPEVSDSGAFVVETPAGRAVAVAVTLAPTAPAGRARRRVLERCRAVLHPAMHPEQVLVLDRLPLRPSGKLDRDALVALAAASAPARQARAGEPAGGWRDPVEAAVAAVVAEACPAPPRSPSDHLLALGGHSLTAARIAARLRDRLGVSVRMGEVLAAGTVAGVADLVRGAPPADDAGLVTPATGEPLPLSFGEERLWFLWRLEPDSTAYCEPVRLRLDGEVDAERLLGAVEAVLARHDALRTRYVPGPDGTPARLVDARPPPVALVDLRAEPDPDAAATAWLERAEAEPFDLAGGPVARAALLRTGDRSCCVALQIHHIACDGWSNVMLVEQILSAYNGEAAPAAAAAPPSYASYAAWQRRTVAGERLERLRAFWRAELDAAPGELRFPLARARREGATRARSVTLQVGGERVDALRGRAREQGATIFHVLLAALGAHLSKLCGSDDVVVASLVGHRPRSDLEEVVGFFVETVPVRLRLDGDAGTDPGTDGLVRRARAAALRALGHADLPFDEIVRAADAPRRPGANPLAQVALNMLNLPEVAVDVPGSSVDVRFGTGGDSKFDVTLYARPDGDGLELRWLLRSEEFTDADAAELAAQFDAVLEAFAGQDRPLREVALDSPARRRLAGAGRLAIGQAGAPPALEGFRARAASQPDAVALDGAGRLTYAELAQRVSAAGEQLRSHAVTDGTAVAVLARRSPALAVAVLALLEHGVPFCIVDATLPAALVRRRIDHLAPGALVEIDGLDLRVEPVGSPAAPLPPGVATLTYTSGTTGRPKLVMAPRHALDRHVAWEAGLLAAGPADRFALLSGLMYDPCLRDVLVPLATGGTLVVPDPDPGADGAALRRWLDEQRVGVWHTTPGMLRVAVEWGEAPGEHLRAVLVGGEALTWRDVAAAAAAFPRARLVCVYGTTETPQVMSAHEADPATAPQGEEVVPLGRGTTTSRLVVVDALGRAAAPGQLGEIAVASPHLAIGYRDEPAHEAFRDDLHDVAGRAYLTGDLGAVDHDGTVHFRGRRDGQLKVAGIRAEPGEIEGVLRLHPDVRQAAVGVAGAGDGVLTAFVVPEQAPGATAEDALRAHLRAHLPAPLVPSVRFVDALRYDRNGKLDVGATAATSRSAATAPAREAPGATAEAVRAIMQDLLGCPVPGVDDDFFRLGGHSLLAARLLARVRREFGVEIPLRDLFPVATARHVAALVEAGDAADDGTEELALLLAALGEDERELLLGEMEAEA